MMKTYTLWIHRAHGEPSFKPETADSDFGAFTAARTLLASDPSIAHVDVTFGAAHLFTVARPKTDGLDGI